MRCCFSGERNPSVRMLCSRSASFTTTTRTSFTMASSILRTFSAWRASGASRSSRLILVTPSTSVAMSGPKRSAMRCVETRVSSTTSCSNAALSVVMSSFMSARICATSRGCERYGSPDCRSCERCCSAANSKARRSSSMSLAGRVCRTFSTSSRKRTCSARVVRSVLLPRPTSEDNPVGFCSEDISLYFKAI